MRFRPDGDHSCACLNGGKSLNSHGTPSVEAASGQGAMTPEQSGRAATQQSAMTRIWNLFAFPAHEDGYFDMHT